MDWDELVATFRALGGIAENVRLGSGRYGRGIFAIEPGKPSKLHAPENLLVPTDVLEIRDGRLSIQTGAPYGLRERAFFDAYQHHFGFGSGAAAQWQTQAEWHDLSGDVADFIKRMGVSDDVGKCFLAPTPDVCAHRFVKARDYAYGGKPHLAPVVDLANHSAAAAPFVIKDGIGIAGTFDGEVLVRYGARDAWTNALQYGFSDVSSFAYSLAIAVDVDGRHSVAINRNVTLADVRDGVAFPQVRLDGRTIHLAYLPLGSPVAPDLPRAVFRKVMEPHLSTADADRTFDGIAQFNRHAFLDLLRLLRGRDGEVARMLENAAMQQLRALSDCVGARNLTATAS
jgi:hypothetical protein